MAIAVPKSAKARVMAAKRQKLTMPPSSGQPLGGDEDLRERVDHQAHGDDKPDQQRPGRLALGSQEFGHGSTKAHLNEQPDR
jgi:hypothetical protein